MQSGFNFGPQVLHRHIHFIEQTRHQTLRLVQQCSKQMLTVHLVVTRGALSNGTVDLSTSFVGRNTDVTTTTNTDTDGDGISDTPVCQAGVGRP